MHTDKVYFPLVNNSIGEARQLCIKVGEISGFMGVEGSPDKTYIYVKGSEMAYVVALPFAQVETRLEREQW